MKITPPQLPAQLNEDIDLNDVLNRKEDDLSDCSFKSQLVEGVTRSNLSVSSCRFSNCSFIKSQFKKGQFSDIVFSYCDLSNIQFTGSSFHRVEFIGCKLTGTVFADATFHQLFFKECRGEYVNMSGSKQRHVFYQNSNLRGGAFDNCKWGNIYFEKCNLIEAEFYQTPLKDIDLSDSEIAGLRINAIPWTELRGVEVTSLQALDFVNLLGIKVKDL